MKDSKVELEETVSKIFHDIKGPLVSISGYLQLLEEDLKDAGVDIDYIDILLSSSLAMDESIDKARLEVNKLVGINT
jgi:signal transduction histidine kinase